MKKIIFLVLLITIFMFPFITKSQVLILSDQSDGMAYLSTDPMDGYFDKVNSLEIAIQLKDTSMHVKERTEAVTAYINSYEKEVVDMKAEEKEKLQTLFSKLFKACNNLNEHILPDTIRLIMVNGNHYGGSTFFTRGHAIIFSRSSLHMMPDQNFEHVMFHELFHIISRYHPELRDKLYNLIGFEYIEEPILFLKSFYDRLLYNPDGVQMDYGISLMMEDSSYVTFVTVISANEDRYKKEKPAFFNYLNFQLYPLDKIGNAYFVRSPEACEKLDMNHIMQQYFSRITMNTHYIIHPDEILADNFLYLFRTEEENKDLDQELLGKIKYSLEQHEK